MAEVVNIGTLETMVIANVQNFQQGMNKVGKAAADTEKKVGIHMANAAQKVRTVGYLMVATVTVPMVAAGKAMMNAARDYEYSMQKIVGLAGVAQRAVNSWNKEVLAMAPTVGKSPKELADALYFISSSGIKGAEALNILKLSAKAATAGLGETREVADLLTSAMNAYAGTGLTSAYATDVLVAAVREGKAEASQFAGAIGQVIPIAAELGVSFDQVAGGMAAITLTGSSTSQAATYLKGIFNSLLRATDNGQKALTSMHSSYQELRDILRYRGVIATLQRVRDLSVEYSEELSSEVFPNIRALTGYLSLSGKNFEYNKGAMDRVRDSTGSLNIALEAVADTIEVRTKMVMADLNVSIVSLGKALATVILPMLEAVVKKISKTTEWFNNLSEAQKKHKVKWALLTAAMGTFLLVISLVMYALNGLGAIIKSVWAGFGFIIKSIKYLTFGLEGLSLAISEVKWTVAATGIGLVAAAVTTLGIVLYKAIRGHKELSEAQKIHNSYQNKFNAQIAEETTILKSLTSAIDDENIPKEVRKNLLIEYNNRYSDYLGYMMTEENYAKNIASAYTLINDELIKRITLETYLAEIKDLVSKRSAIENERVELYKIEEKISYKLFAQKEEDYLKDIADFNTQIDFAVKKMQAYNEGISLIAFLIGDEEEIEMQKMKKEDELAIARKKQEEELARQRAEELTKMGLIERLEAKLETSKNNMKKAKSIAEINKEYSIQLSLQRQIDAIDPEARLKNKTEAYKREQEIEENKVKMMIQSSEKEGWALYNIQLAYLDKQIALYKGHDKEVQDLTLKRESLIADYTIKAKKDAAKKYTQELENQWAIERMMADRNAELTIKDDDKRARAIEANRLEEQKKLLGARVITSYFTGAEDPTLLKDLTEYKIALEKNSGEELIRLKKVAHDKANEMETMAGQLTELEKEKDWISDKEYDRRKREILIAFWAFEKSGAQDVSISLQDMTRDELNAVKNAIEDEIEITKDKEKQLDLIRKLGWVNAVLRAKAAYDRMKSMAEVVSQQVSDLAANMTITVGESFAKMMLGTGGMEETFNAILSVFADFLIGLGKAMITTATVIEGFQKALESMQWEVAVMLGVSAIIAGTLLKNYIAKGPKFEEVTSYGEGGYAGKPQLAVVGDAKDGKGEWILNSRQMGSLINSRGTVSDLTKRVDTLAKWTQMLIAGVPFSFLAGRNNYTELMKMQNGGMLYGPSVVLAGEYAGARRNPEVFSPLDQLKTILQPDLEKRELVAVVRGRDIAFVLEQDNASTNRMIGRG